MAKLMREAGKPEWVRGDFDDGKAGWRPGPRLSIDPATRAVAQIPVQASRTGAGDTGEPGTRAGRALWRRGDG
ncbi:hypothetical protein [Methanoregula formicica]|uniref:Uncharacterized protein n=1 Tax=Methanoregula formicica (strain DSM 22288 / NBRC 105244 / SMSP) TaxID=593750 RepID=L0HDM6_METFS|nr:hypothetical protein [Methanoregula formicica]AGB02827.1 hypothetical protein Metfor_1804 [Methanoregula formicica SMSP]